MAIDLVNRFRMAVQSSTRKTENSPTGNLVAGDGDVRRNFPAAFALVLDAQHQHGQAVEGEAPDHAEGIGLAQQVDIAVADQNGEDLQKHDQVDDPVGGAEARMRLAEPVGENAVFRNAVEDSVGTDDRGIDRARQDQEAHDHHEGAESQPQQQRARTDTWPARRSGCPCKSGPAPSPE